MTLESGDCNGCMNVAWGLGWGGSRGMKPCGFSGAAAVVPGANRFSLGVLQRIVL